MIKRGPIITYFLCRFSLTPHALILNQSCTTRVYYSLYKKKFYSQKQVPRVEKQDVRLLCVVPFDNEIGQKLH